MIEPSATLLIAALLGASSSPPAAGQCGATLPNWTATKKVPEGKTRPLNVLAVGTEGALVWNGTAVTERTAREFLRLIRKEMPRNVTALVADRDADCAAVVRIRRMMNDELACGPTSCVQVLG